MKHFPLATFVNMLTVIVGSSIGLLLQQVFPQGVQEIFFQAVGLGTLLIGIKMSLKLPEGYLLIFLFSLMIGGIIGELIQLDVILNNLSEQLKHFFSIEDSQFTEGLITAFLLFCVGSMTIIGALEEGLQQKRELLYVKSTLDGFSSIAFASTYGIGVMFSVIPMLFLQGGITVAAGGLKSFFDEKTLFALSAVGGILIVGISINMLQLGDIRLENLLPSLILILIFSKLYQRYFTERKKSDVN